MTQHFQQVATAKLKDRQGKAQNSPEMPLVNILTWGIFFLAAAVLGYVVIEIGRQNSYYLPANEQNSSSTNRTTVSTSKLTKEYSPSSNGNARPNVIPVVYSDTAMILRISPDLQVCHAYIDEALQKLSLSVDLRYRAIETGLFLAGFADQSDNYVARCFKIDPSDYRTIVAGSGLDSKMLERNMKIFYRAINGK